MDGNGCTQLRIKEKVRVVSAASSQYYNIKIFVKITVHDMDLSFGELQYIAHEKLRVSYAQRNEMSK